MDAWYDHGSFGVDMKNMALYDLTKWPFTKSPKKYHENLMAGLSTVETLGNGCELITCQSLTLITESYYSQKCQLKPKSFSSKMTMRMAPLKLSYFGEPVMRFNDYFQNQFLSALMQSDPYQNPKKEFDRIKKLHTLTADDLMNKDLKQLKEIGLYDIQIEQA